MNLPSILFLSLAAFAAENRPAIVTDFPKAEICEAVKVEFPDLLGETEASESMQLCHDRKFLMALSKNCKNDQCDLIKAAAAASETLTYSDRGTPSSWLCQQLGGESRMVFMNKHKIYICRKGKDLVAADYLITKLGLAKNEEPRTKPNPKKK